MDATDAMKDFSSFFFLFLSARSLAAWETSNGKGPQGSLELLCGRGAYTAEYSVQLCGRGRGAVWIGQSAAIWPSWRRICCRRGESEGGSVKKLLADSC